MSNDTAPIIAVEPLLPECVRGLDMADYNVDNAQKFDLTSSAYYEEVLPSVVPGIVMGTLSLLGFIFFLVWMCFHRLCCCNCCSSGGSPDPSAAEQFISNRPSTADSKSSLSSYQYEQQKPKRSTLGWIYMIFLALLAIVAVLLSVWGIVSSCNLTDSQITDFWGIVDTVDDRVQGTVYLMGNATNKLEDLQTRFETVQGAESEVQQFVTLQGYTGAPIAEIFNGIEGAIDKVDEVQTAITNAQQEVQTSMGDAIQQIEDDYKKPSLVFEEKGRFIAIVILFCANILLIILSVLLVWHCKSISCASFTVALLWFFVMLLMLLGMALMDGIYQVTTDTCLYAESYATAYVRDQVDDPVRKAWALRALTYYLTPTEQQKLEDDPIKGLFNVDLSGVQEVVANADIDTLSFLLNTTTDGATLSEELRANLNSVIADVKDFNSTVDGLKALASLGAVIPIYNQLKSYICCDFSDASSDLWVSWTAVGVITFIVALMCSLRIVYKSRGTKNY